RVELDIGNAVTLAELLELLGAARDAPYDHTGRGLDPRRVDADEATDLLEDFGCFASRRSDVKEPLRHRQLEGGEGAARALGALPRPTHFLRDALRRDVDDRCGADRPRREVRVDSDDVGLAPGEPQDAFPAAADEQRGVRSLHRPGHAVAVMDVVRLADERDRFVAEEALDGRDRVG